MKKKHGDKAGKLPLHILLFCYIFAFYIGPLSISLLIAIPLFVYIMSNKEWTKTFLRLSAFPYIQNVFMGIILLNVLAVIFPLVYRTLDWSFFRISAMQFVHFAAALPVFLFLYIKKYSVQDIIKSVIVCFVIQTLIQVVCILNQDSIGVFIRIFNKYEVQKQLADRVRGYALSAATTYHLSLSYGVCFILYIYYILHKSVKIADILIGLLIVLGIFFPGRTGFVGVMIGCFYFLASLKKKMLPKMRAIFSLLIVIGSICALFYLFAPENLRSTVFDAVLPYAFEFLYNKTETGQFSTASTNRLLEMWSSNFDLQELVLGSGNYEVNGHYYMRVDPGILRHPLFFGIAGYLYIFFYQFYILLPFTKVKRNYKALYFFISCFIVAMDFKAVTIGLNKFTFALSILFSFSFLYLGSEQYEKTTFDHRLSTE